MSAGVWLNAATGGWLLPNRMLENQMLAKSRKMTGFVGAGRRAVPELAGRVGEVCGGLGFVGTGFWVGMGPLLLPKTAFGADLYVRE